MRKNFRKIVLTAAVMLIALISVGAFAACSAADPTFDVVKSDGDFGGVAFSHMKYLAENYPDRTMGSQGEADAARYIASIMSDLGYTGKYSYEGEEGLQGFKVSYTRYDGSAVNDVNAFNVAFTKKAAEPKGEILLTAQYDNLYGEKTSEELWQADGSYESGSGVAVLLTLAKLLSETDCGYDLTFAFFTGGSYCWQGAYRYVAQLTGADLDGISLMLNFAMLGGGEYLYLYTRETSTDYGGYLRSVSDGLTQIPKDKNVSAIVMETDPLYAYSHIGMTGNHYYFMDRGIPTANYLSHNWSRNDQPFVTEIKDKANVYHTADDTLANMVERKGEENISAMLSNVINSVLGALDGQNSATFDAVLSTARDQSGSVGQESKASSVIAVAVKLAFVALFFALALTVRSYIHKNSSKYRSPEPEKAESVKPFDFDNYPKEGEDKSSDQTDKGGENRSDDPFV